MSKKSKAEGDKGEPGAKSGKGKGKGAGAQTPAPPHTIAGNRRAATHVRRAKSWGGLACFVLALTLSLNASLTVADSLERALIAGIAGYVIAWASAVVIWRALLAAELRARVERIKARRLELATRANEHTR